MIPMLAINTYNRPKTVKRERFPMKKAKQYVDKILTKDRFNNFWEVTGTRGGDVVRYRLYDDGMVTER